MQNKDDVMEIDLQEIIVILFSRIWLIALCGAILAAAGFSFSKFMITPTYQSTTKVYILNKDDTGTVAYSDIQLSTYLSRDYAELIKCRDVLEAVIGKYKLEESYKSFANRVTVENVTDTRIIAITVEDEDPVMAQILAAEVRKIASDHIKTVMDIQAVNVAEEANLPTEPSSPSVFKWTALGLLVGGFLAAAVIVVKYLLDDTVKSSEDVEKYLGLSTLAMIPIMEGEEQSKAKKVGRLDFVKINRNVVTLKKIGKEKSEAVAPKVEAPVAENLAEKIPNEETPNEKTLNEKTLNEETPAAKPEVEEGK